MLKLDIESDPTISFPAFGGGKLRLGILGGTFDPVHYGHLHMAEYTRQEFNLDKIIFIPAGRPPHKELDLTPKTAPQERYEMLLLATEDNDCFYVWNYEIQKKEKSYTIETMKVLEKMLPDSRLFFILGADALAEIFTWKSPQEFLLGYDIIVCSRGKVAEGVAGAVIARVPHAKIHPLSIPYLEISATGIRRRLSEGKSVRYYTAPSVIRYIAERSLYG